MNSYQLGKERAKLTDNQVAPWMLKEGRKPLMKTNEAFKLYYDSYQRIRQLYKSTTKSHISLAANQAIKLQDIAATGYGSWLCCSDLNTILEYYYNHNGTYKEDNSYVQETLHYDGGYCTVPRGIKNFLEAYKACVEEMGVLFKNFDQYAKALTIAKKNNKWNEIGSNIANIKTVTDKSSEYLWLMPYDISNLTGYVDKVKKWTDGMDVVYSFANSYINNTSAGMRNGQASAMTAASIGLTAVLGKLPVFGEVYIKALESIPALMKWATNLRDSREQQLRAAGFYN